MTLAQTASQLVGWVPALVFPLAGVLQLVAIIKAKSSRGVSVASWLLFAVANVCLYVYVGKYVEPQAILSGLGTATMNIAVVITALRFRPRESRGC
ncbi:MAG: hypothetical protein SGJ09_10165 [Phycisphaerae bacterium]|nr:hypothetical protein [Phycisphaerae bacterium]